MWFLEADELAAKLDEDQKRTLPLPGQVDVINGGPPCQGFSRMNWYSQRPWSKIQCQTILTFLSFADYFRPSYLLLENVRAFVSYSKGHMFRLTLVSLLEMGYQLVRTSSSYKPCLSFKKACFSTWSSTRRGSSGRFVGLRDVGERVEEERNVEWLGIR
ncbi:unnamed protein product [Eruca vesicaria subsp. sativa]|uniref:DNA (cytosine-5-)-methyltransferase n=1 Tax=Eruca vesicaria subsp. sativa TaxID=29727 RepID=A0ABC8K061_ERUVS|nr:unnamed protein product [Eruca vesicaria subsp. sativa]